MSFVTAVNIKNFSRNIKLICFCCNDFRLQSLALDEKRNSINEKIARKERKKQKKKKKQERESEKQSNSSSEYSELSNSGKTSD